MSTSLFIVLRRNVSIDTLAVAASTSVKFFFVGNFHIHCRLTFRNLQSFYKHSRSKDIKNILKCLCENDSTDILYSLCKSRVDFHSYKKSVNSRFKLDISLSL